MRERREKRSDSSLLREPVTLLLFFSPFSSTFVCLFLISVFFLPSLSPVAEDLLVFLAEKSKRERQGRSLLNWIETLPSLSDSNTRQRWSSSLRQATNSLLSFLYFVVVGLFFGLFRVCWAMNGPIRLIQRKKKQKVMRERTKESVHRDSSCLAFLPLLLPVEKRRRKDNSLMVRRENRMFFSFSLLELAPLSYT